MRIVQKRLHVSFSFTSYVVSYVAKYISTYFPQFLELIVASCFVSVKGDIRSDEGPMDERERDMCVGESVG